MTARVISAWVDSPWKLKAAWCLLIKSVRQECSTKMIQSSSEERGNKDGIYSWAGQRRQKQMSVSATEKAASLFLLLQVSTGKCWKQRQKVGIKKGKGEESFYAPQ